MKPDEYTISPKLCAVIEREFKPFLKEKIDGVPLAKWLDQKHIPNKTTSADYKITALRLSHKLENILALEGGPEGLTLLEAFDGIIHGGGNPALLLHGLPKEGIVSPIIREAFRAILYQDCDKQSRDKTGAGQLRLIDKRTRNRLEGFDARSDSSLHQHGTDITLIFGVKAGANPRHTMLITLPEFFDSIADASKKQESPITSEQIRELFLLPIWSAEDSRNLNKAAKPFGLMRIERLNSLGKLRVDTDGTEYGPLICDNPAYCEEIAGSQPFTLEVPISLPRIMFNHIDRTMVPEHLLAALETLRQTIIDDRRFIDFPVRRAKAGPILKSGDLLLINDRLMLHGGGSFMYDKLPWLRQLPGWGQRHIVNMDVNTHDPKEYWVPGSQNTKPISFVEMVDGKRVAEINTPLAPS